MLSKFMNLQLSLTKTLDTVTDTSEAIKIVIESLKVELGWDHATFWEPDQFADSPKLVQDAFSANKALLTNDEPDKVAIPVFSQDKIYGVMEFSGIRKLDESSDLILVMNALGSQIGQSFFRSELIGKLSKKQEELVDFIENGSLPLHWVGPDGIIIWANQAELNALGYSKEEYIGQSITSFHADGDVITDILTRLTNNEILHNYEARLVRKDGSIRDVLISSSVYRVDDKFIHTRCFTRDVTEIVQGQKLLQNAVKLRDDFLSIASHELLTPVTSLKLQFQLLEKSGRGGSVDSLSTPKVLTRLDSSLRQINRLTRLIEDLLDVSKISNDNLNCTFEETDLTEIVNEVLVRLDYQINEEKIEIIFESSEPIKGEWDRSRIDQVVTNLITNAIKYGNQKPIHLLLESDEKTVRFKVRDQGMGISEKDQKRVFERFERAVSVKNFGGLGLGLYISNDIVKTHGGLMYVESELGKGSTFIVELPKIKA